MKSKNIAIAGEITPSKTIIPIIEKLKERENWHTSFQRIS